MPSTQPRTTRKRHLQYPGLHHCTPPIRYAYYGTPNPKEPLFMHAAVMSVWVLVGNLRI
jgi:hypothetical protein